MHAIANLAILTKSCHSIDDDEYGEISPIFPKLNVSYANYPNTGSPMLTWQTNRRFVGTPILSSIHLWQNFVKIAILAEFAGFVKIAASSVPLSRAQSLFGEIRQSRRFPSNIDLWRNFVKTAKFAIACISGHISEYVAKIRKRSEKH